MTGENILSYTNKKKSKHTKIKIDQEHAEAIYTQKYIYINAW